MRPESGFRIAPNWPQIWKMIMTSQFFDMTSLSTFFDFFFLLFLLWNLVTGSSFLSISSLILELRQFSFIRDWLEIQKSETPPSEFWPISGDWAKLGIPNLARMPLIKCQGCSFYRFWVIKGKPTGGGGEIIPLHHPD